MDIVPKGVSEVDTSTRRVVSTYLLLTCLGTSTITVKREEKQPENNGNDAKAPGRQSALRGVGASHRHSMRFNRGAGNPANGNCPATLAHDRRRPSFRFVRCDASARCDIVIEISRNPCHVPRHSGIHSPSKRRPLDRGYRRVNVAARLSPSAAIVLLSKLERRVAWNLEFGIWNFVEESFAANWNGDSRFERLAICGSKTCHLQRDSDRCLRGPGTLSFRSSAEGSIFDRRFSRKRRRDARDERRRA